MNINLGVGGGGEKLSSWCSSGRQQGRGDTNEQEFLSQVAR